MIKYFISSFSGVFHIDSIFKKSREKLQSNEDMFHDEFIMNTFSFYAALTFYSFCLKYHY